MKSQLLTDRRLAITLIFSSALLVTTIIGFLVKPFQTDTHNDVIKYYQSGRSLQSAEHSAVDVFIRPFYANRNNLNNNDWILMHFPAQAKPIYMLAYNTWNTLYDLIDRPNGESDRQQMRRELSNFTLFTHFLLFITLAYFGYRYVNLAVGISAATLATLNPWALIYLYYPAYTQLSQALFIFTLYMLFWPGCKSSRRMAIGGAALAITLLSNPSMLLYIGALGLALTLVELPNFKEGFRKGVWLLIGFFAIFFVLELLKFPVQYLLNDFNLMGPGETLYSYFAHSANRNHFLLRGHATVFKYPGMFLLINYYNSFFLMALIIATMVLLYNRFIKHGISSLIGDEYRLATQLLFIALLVILIIELTPGTVQLGRSYFIGFPLLILGSAIFWNSWQSGVAHQWRKAGAILLALLSLELCYNLYRQRAAFHSLNPTLRVELPGTKKAAIFKPDPHLNPIINMVEPDLDSRVITVNNYEELSYLIQQGIVSHLLTGPEIDSIATWFPKPFQPIPPNRLLHRNETGIIQAGAPTLIPFYGHYPLLLFEDEYDTMRFINGEFTAQDYCCSTRGTLKLWPLNQRSF